ncbi:16S rRNA (cytosine(1402)-N(4))-methyltransferase RsmH [Hornefia butyriciproducens]|uniref:Ribosomal RNA small subunit methyltransferase H n=1 Tax=Hornefia butyriciproducens TaxID=2652293 RepID=A0A6L5Y4R9_9FIRM|nr:16S rRNA (cytosine(1402)-N(4))-methyltransferase RsmH [Hornefia butyriciproducens]MCI7412306.1 16S rRNA (cytosine(1402)-N(4))-methyltransferase RsmH [Clostridiales bacterium]MCI7680015.1 16S rRNA (cytosine(1402)-N(4))-methyltransferase RsmH [Clostridiales bacterium]MDY6211314.1 16S rRNA (cytosine(1402)-N(4))-methyltransferase RsmH [Hornefia butyriciproducens]MST51455.1 16S rRNA (cytosine(1402)-N(4))-methyltransferase RsmH [Hornefia butyriciproducens]
MEFRHTPVLLDQCIENLNIRPDGIYVDGTLGGGGHSFHICERLSEQGMLIGIDRDRDALEAAEKRLREFSCRKYFVQSNYADIRTVLAEKGIEKIDGALLDIGVSSFQLDNAERGFSYMQDAPLDMRMNREDDLTAYDVVNSYDRDELTRIIREYGEERWASRIAAFIVRARAEKPVESTSELVELIKEAIPARARRSGPHPAKRTFQAIRIEVNDELGELSRAVDEYLDVMNPGGRLCIITFHSLEDRIVKQKLQKRADPCTCPPEFPVCVCGKKADIRKVTRKPIVAEASELDLNPRARSAKLRVCEKI